MDNKVSVNIKTEYVRAAAQAAAGRGLKVPSLEWEDFVAKFLTHCRFELVQ